MITTQQLIKIKEHTFLVHATHFSKEQLLTILDSMIEKSKKDDVVRNVEGEVNNGQNE